MYRIILVFKILPTAKLTVIVRGGKMIRQSHLDRFPIDPGFRIYEPAMIVRGLRHRKADVIRFLKGNFLDLKFVIVPDGAAFEGAIEIHGTWKSWFRWHSAMIGYVPKEVAGALASADLKTMVRPRLVRTVLGAKGFVEVTFQVVGPKAEYERYKRQNRDDEGDIEYVAPT